jgi:hypothetical protein
MDFETNKKKREPAVTHSPTPSLVQQTGANAGSFPETGESS